MIANRRWIRKNVYDKFKLDELKDGAGRSIVDPMVYNDGTLRTYLSCKSSKPYRPFQFEAGSEHESELESFIGYSFPGGYDITIGRVDEESVRDREASQSTTLEPEQDRAIREFVSKKFMVPTDRITATMRLGTSDPQVYIADFKDTPCKIADREHKSNCQYVVIGPKKATYKCRDVADCSQKKDERLTISFAEYTDGLKQMLMKPGPDLKAEMKALIRKRTNDSPSGSPIYDLEQGSLSMAESSLSTFYDENDPGTHIMTPKAYKLRRLNSTTKFNGSIEEAPLIMKHITINKHYYGAVEESAYNLKLPFGLFDPTLSDLWERALGLTGEDTLAKIFSRDEKEVVYSAGSYYCFTGSVWVRDDEGVKATHRIKAKLVKELESIVEAFVGDEKAMNVLTKTNKLLDSNKGLSNILSRSKFMLANEGFASALGSKIRLIPFTNGVYDIEKSEFRNYMAEDLFSHTVGYEYDPTVVNPEVEHMLSSILPEANIKNFFVNSVAKALDGSIPNTRFIMMVGETASNGKTCLMNLMSKTFGMLSETMNPTSLTRKEADPSTASPHLAKLQNVRLVCLSEPEKGELNTASLKRLFGGEVINARFLHHNEITFKLLAKAFIACNAPPKIDPTDQGAWRRIVCVPFNSRFVETPTLPNEFPVDTALSYRIDTDVSFRQTFMNLLIGQLNEDVPMPETVVMRTTQVRDCNDGFTQWLKESIVVEAGKMLYLQEIVQVYKGEIVKGTKALSKYKVRVDTFLNETFNIPTSNYIVRPNNGSRKRCWIGFNISK